MLHIFLKMLLNVQWFLCYHKDYPKNDLFQYQSGNWLIIRAEHTLKCPQNVIGSKNQAQRRENIQLRFIIGVKNSS